ncbi:MAG: glycine--tRNA ligase, partial [Chloroflexi bacterium]|nr:glycine--tRNA ligase [Chloroflexota bacterium]
TEDQWFKQWVQARLDWWTSLGLRRENLRVRAHDKAELAHYSKGTSDIEFKYAWDWGELEGIASRGDFDLKQHSKYSGKEIKYFDEETKESYVPYVVEPASGVDRGFLAFLTDAYEEQADKEEIRTVLHLHPAIAPIKVAVLPLSKKDTLTPLAREIHATLRKHWSSQYDDTQSIGRRYRRQDEVGTPLCVTVDFESLNDKQVTIRERDSMAQVRLPIADLVPAVREKLGL